jgi:hypothetical protein
MATKLYSCKHVKVVEGFGYTCDTDRCLYGNYQIKELDTNFCSVGGNVSTTKPDQNLVRIDLESRGKGAEFIERKLSQIV